MTHPQAAVQAIGAVRRPALPDVVHEHLEEHGFLSAQRRKLAFSLEVPARRLAEHDERIAAHWDGLVVNAPASGTLAGLRLGADDPWERASAVRAWLVFARPSAAEVRARWEETPPDHAPSWREALRGLATERLEEVFPARDLADIPPSALALAVDARGWNAGLAEPAVAAAARHPDAVVRAALARVLGLSADPERAARVLADLAGDADAGVRRRALWSAALVDRASALERARAQSAGSAPDAFALRVLGLLGSAEDLERLTRAASTESGRPAAFHALADLGDAGAVEALLRLLTLPGEPERLAVSVALDAALGEIPRADAEIPARPEEGRAHWARVREGLREDARVLGGSDARWRGEAGEEPGAWRWRAAVTRPRGDAGWRREVPDGFFDAVPAPDARPGE